MNPFRRKDHSEPPKLPIRVNSTSSNNTQSRPNQQAPEFQNSPTSTLTPRTSRIPSDTGFARLSSERIASDPISNTEGNGRDSIVTSRQDDTSSIRSGRSSLASGTKKGWAYMKSKILKNTKSTSNAPQEILGTDNANRGSKDEQRSDQDQDRHQFTHVDPHLHSSSQTTFYPLSAVPDQSHSQTPMLSTSLPTQQESRHFSRPTKAWNMSHPENENKRNFLRRRDSINSRPGTAEPRVPSITNPLQPESNYLEWDRMNIGDSGPQHAEFQSNMDLYEDPPRRHKDDVPASRGPNNEETGTKEPSKESHRKNDSEIEVPHNSQPLLEDTTIKVNQRLIHDADTANLPSYSEQFRDRDGPMSLIPEASYAEGEADTSLMGNIDSVLQISSPHLRQGETEEGSLNRVTPVITPVQESFVGTSTSLVNDVNLSPESYYQNDGHNLPPHQDGDQELPQQSSARLVDQGFPSTRDNEPVNDTSNEGARGSGGGNSGHDTGSNPPTEDVPAPRPETINDRSLRQKITEDVRKTSDQGLLQDIWSLIQSKYHQTYPETQYPSLRNSNQARPDIKRAPLDGPTSNSVSNPFGPPDYNPPPFRRGTGGSSTRKGSKSPTGFPTSLMADFAAHTGNTKRNQNSSVHTYSAPSSRANTPDVMTPGFTTGGTSPHSEGYFPLHPGENQMTSSPKLHSASTISGGDLSGQSGALTERRAVEAQWRREMNNKVQNLRIQKLNDAELRTKNKEIKQLRNKIVELTEGYKGLKKEYESQYQELHDAKNPVVRSEEQQIASQVGTTEWKERFGKLHDEHSRFRAQLQEKENVIEELSKQLDSTNGKLGSLQREVHERDDEITRLNEEEIKKLKLGVLDPEMTTETLREQGNTHNEERTALERKILDLQKEVDGRDQKILEMGHQDTKIQIIRNVQRDLDAQNEKVRRLEKELKEKKESIEGLVKRADARDDTIMRLTADRDAAEISKKARELNDEFREGSQPDQPAWEEIFKKRDKQYQKLKEQYSQLQKKAEELYRPDLEAQNSDLRDKLTKCQGRKVDLKGQITALRDELTRVNSERTEQEAMATHYGDQLQEQEKNHAEEVARYVRDYYDKVKDGDYWDMQKLQKRVDELKARIEKLETMYNDAKREKVEAWDVAQKLANDLTASEKARNGCEQKLALAHMGITVQPNSPDDRHGDGDGRVWDGTDASKAGPNHVPRYMLPDEVKKRNQVMQEFREQQRRKREASDASFDIIEKVREWWMTEAHYPPYKRNWEEVKSMSSWRRWYGETWLRVQADEQDKEVVRKLKEEGLLT